MRRFAVQPLTVVDSELPWDLAEPAREELRLQHLERVLSNDGTDLAKLLETITQIGRAQALQGKLEDADRTLTRAESMLDEDSPLAARLRALLERGRLLVLQKRPMEGRTRFLQVRMLAVQDAEDYYAVDATQMLSVIETKRRKAAWTKEALRIAEASTDPRARTWIGALNADLGAYYEELMQFSDALARFEKAVECFEANEGGARQGAEARSAIGSMLRRMERADEALQVQRCVERDLKAVGRQDGFVFEEIAECLRVLGFEEDATGYFRRAHEMLAEDPWLKNHDPARLKRMKTLGGVK